MNSIAACYANAGWWTIDIQARLNPISPIIVIDNKLGRLISIIVDPKACTIS